MDIKDFVPPIVLRAVRKLRPRARVPSAAPKLSEIAFASYADAVAACDGFGYEQQDLVEIICRKTAIYRDKCNAESAPMLAGVEMPVLIGLGIARRPTGEINVLDFGGACGAHYFRAKSILRDSVRLNWRVVETPKMVEKARELANSELSFYESLSEATKDLDRVDLLFSSGTIQCVPDPYRTMEELLACRAEIIVLSRAGLTEDERDHITIHETTLAENGPGPLPPGMANGLSRYPFTYPVRSRIEGMLSEDYRIVLQSPEESGVLSAHSGLIIGISFIAQHRHEDVEFSHALVRQTRDGSAALQTH